MTDQSSRMPRTMEGGLLWRKVHVEKPLTHQIGRQRYTTYQVNVETNDIAFSWGKTCVRRRYSEFAWLRSQLVANYPDRVAPNLPPKKFFGGQFRPEVIETRRFKLQEFLHRVIEEPVYLSDGAVHLFLQTPLSVNEMEAAVDYDSSCNVADIVVKKGQACSVGMEDSGIFDGQISPVIGSPCSRTTLTFPDETGTILPSDVNPSPSPADHVCFPHHSSQQSAAELCPTNNSIQCYCRRLSQDNVVSSGLLSNGLTDALTVCDISSDSTRRTSLTNGGRIREDSEGGSDIASSTSGASSCLSDDTDFVGLLKSDKKRAQKKVKQVTFSPRVTVARVIDNHH